MTTLRHIRNNIISATAAFTLAAATCGKALADETLLYVNINNVPTSEMNNGIPASTGLTCTWNDWGFPTVTTPESIGFPKRTTNVNEKMIRFRDSSAWNRLYPTAAPNATKWNLNGQRLSFWGYAKWEPVIMTEEAFGVVLRAPYSKTPNSSWTRQGYFCFFGSKGSYWTPKSGRFYPRERTPFIMRANADSTWDFIARNEGYAIDPKDGWHLYSAQMVNNTITMSVDGVVVLEATDSSSARYQTGFPMLFVYWDDQTNKDAAGNWTAMGYEEIKFEKVDATLL